MSFRYTVAKTGNNRISKRSVLFWGISIVMQYRLMSTLLKCYIIIMLVFRFGCILVINRNEVLGRVKAMDAARAAG